MGVANTISVTHNGGAGGTVLAFTDSGSLRDTTRFTVNFVGTGGTLGTAGANPRITFSGALSTNTTNGMLANSSGTTAQTTGWAVVNGTSWAGTGANGIVALADVSRNSATLASAVSQELVGFAPSTTVTTLSANLGTSATVGIGGLKISPTASGQSLNVSILSIFSPSLMLTGTTDFSVTGSTGGLQIGSGTRYVWVTEEGTALNYGASFPSTGPINKSGAGVLNLNGMTSQLPAANINLLQGVLRGTTTTLGGDASSGGANTTINLRGGVLEISGGLTLFRALLTAGTASGGAIGWDNSGTNRGDGGFSAIGGNAAVALTTAAGGTTFATPIWNDGVFVSNGYSLIMGSTKSDSRIVFQNDIGLDNGTAANSYFAREIRVVDNTASTTDVARLSGNITGSANADLLKTGGGTLELTGTNTFGGNTLVQQGTLIAGGSGSLSSTSGVVVSNGGTLLLGSSGTSIGNSVPLILAGGKFSTGGNIEGDLTTAGIGSLSSSTSTSVIDFGTSGPSTVNFNSIGSVTGTLSVWNWTSGDGFFVSSGTVGEYNQVNFYDGDTTLNNLSPIGGGGAFLVAATGGNFELVPVPEVGALFGALGLLAPLAWRERRHWMRCREARV